MESEKEKRQNEQEHLEIAHAFTSAGERVAELKVNLKSAINKSR